MQIYGDTLSTNEYSFNFLKKVIESPLISPQFRISVLNPDESVNYVIPNNDILLGGISYTENYQNGQRRNITLSLNNESKRYTPNISGIWVNTKFKFEVGLEYRNKIIWFPKGIYILGNIDLTNNNNDKTISYQLLDKFALFEGKTGTLETAYEIPVGSTIVDAVRGVQNFTQGNGYILDYKEAFFDPSLINLKTQSTIRIEEGSNLGEVIQGLATQISAEYYYNNLGYLCFYPVNETINDTNKPIIWTYKNLNRDINNIGLNYATEEVVNIIKVVGDNIDNGISSYTAVNNNPMSPLCVEQIGKRMAPTYNESNVWSNELAHDLACYYLRKASFFAITFNSTVNFNPILTVNNICELEDEFLNLKREKLLITSISFTSDSGQMNISLCNTSELPMSNKGR